MQFCQKFNPHNISTSSSSMPDFAKIKLILASQIFLITYAVIFSLHVLNRLHEQNISCPKTFAHKHLKSIDFAFAHTVCIEQLEQFFFTFSHNYICKKGWKDSLCNLKILLYLVCILFYNKIIKATSKSIVTNSYSMHICTYKVNFFIMPCKLANSIFQFTNNIHSYAMQQYTICIPSCVSSNNFFKAFVHTRLLYVQWNK